MERERERERKASNINQVDTGRRKTGMEEGVSEEQNERWEAGWIEGGVKMASPPLLPH